MQCQTREIPEEFFSTQTANQCCAPNKPSKYVLNTVYLNDWIMKKKLENYSTFIALWI